MCNYDCEFCFAKWNSPKGVRKTPEIWSVPKVVHKILSELSNRDAVSRKFCEAVTSVRINFAGGEPLLLGDKFLEIIKLAKEMGFETSIITNGSLLYSNSEVYKYIDILGISVDSLDADICRKIGRCDGSDKVLEEEHIKELLATARAENPDISVKFNVTVNMHNYKECVVERLQGFSPNRIKILRQLPFGDNQGISDDMYSEFKRINGRCFGENIVVEDNEDMTQSYLMIDPYGRLFQNGNSDDYIYSGPIHEVGLERALSKIPFDKERFGSRYKNIDKKGDAL